MSVEKQTEDSPTSAIPQKIEQEKSSMEEASCNEEETVEITSPTSAGLDGVTETEMSVETEMVTSEARTWFAALSNEERVVALGFMDGPFLATLFDCSPWSANSPEKANAPVGEYQFLRRFDRDSYGPRNTLNAEDIGTTDRSMLMANSLWIYISKSATQVAHPFLPLFLPVDSGGLDWSHKVNLKEVKEKYAFFTKEMMKSDVGDESASSKLKSKDEGEVKKGTDEDGKERRLESDAFRIRSGSESQLGNVAKESGEATTTTKSVNEAVPPICDHMCVVFPSAFKFVSGKSVDERECIPYVTVKPTYLDASDGELLLSLDASARSLFGTPFLCNEFSQSRVSTAWLDRLARGSGATTKEVTEVSCFALLLSRLESAVWVAFEQQKRGSHVDSTTSVEIMTSSDRKLHRRRQQKDYAWAQETKVGGEERRQRRTFAEGSVPTVLMTDLMSHARASNILSVTVETAVLERLISPFTEAFFDTDFRAEPHNNLGSLFLTPLSWLARRRHERFDFARLDGAVDVTLRRIKEHGLSLTTEAETPAGVVSKQAPVQDVVEDEDAEKDCGPTAMPTKKKRKKRNKRRVSLPYLPRDRIEL